MDLSGLQQNTKPTRDVLVVFDDTGDREFVGFGSAKNEEFADCFLEADKLPKEAIKVSGCLDAHMGKTLSFAGGLMNLKLHSVRHC